jgi:uncharacterized membrane protein YjjP (DUF1212 family)
MFKNLRDVDPLDKLLLLSILFFAGMLIYIARWAPNDGQTFQVISGLLTGFSGAFLARIKPKADPNTAVTTSGTTTDAPIK